MSEREKYCNVYKFKVLEGNVRDIHQEREKKIGSEKDRKQTKLNAKEESNAKKTSELFKIKCEDTKDSGSNQN
ncbi:hypothetical protein B7P43_G15480 [Cryptotermes secundus]|uniref:Uncharacterized protein n=1 Tax=Cryptotermes secundus TaxID=105785 RepID=A0A2J7R6U5_9NEOP|nr:hypothetical protein B7P43_G15480 [Cryptotermes secundus]